MILSGQVRRLTWFTREAVPLKKEVPPDFLDPIPADKRHEAGLPPAVQFEMSDDSSPGKHLLPRPAPVAGSWAATRLATGWWLHCCLSLSLSSLGPLGGKKASKLMTLLLWVCGMERKGKDTPALRTTAEASVAPRVEPPWVEHLLNLNLILSLSACVFLWAYFA